MSSIHVLTAGQAVDRSGGSTEMDGFEAFFRATYPAIVSTALRIVGNTQEAEEIASEAFIRLFHEPGTVQNRVGWLKRCAVRLSVDCLRASRRRKRREEASPPVSAVPCPESSVRQNQQRFQVRQILAELPKREAEILMARAEGFSYAEIAESFGLNPASIGKFLMRAEAHFRRRYESQYGAN